MSSQLRGTNDLRGSSQTGCRDSWKKWKSAYEANVDQIIKDRLHVARSAKKEGLLNPEFRIQSKQEIIRACVRTLCQRFFYAKEQCSGQRNNYRILLAHGGGRSESFNAYLKNQRRSLVSQERLQ